MIKGLFKKICTATGRYTLISIRWLIRRMPYPIYRCASFLLFPIGQLVLLSKKKVALESLRMAYGQEKSPEEIRKIMRACFNVFGRGMLDLLYIIDRPDMVRDRVSFRGKEHLDAVLAEGKGAVIVSAHFGNFLLMYFRMVIAGYATNVIMRRTHDSVFERYITKLRDERGVKTIFDLPPRPCIQQSIKALRNNEVLIILLDQNYGSAGRIFVDFFGHKAATAAGPVVFSNRTDAPILPAFIMEEEPGYHTISVQPPLTLVKKETEEESQVANISMITQIIEQQIRKNPHQWAGWFHRRWKSKPVEEQRIIDQQSKDKVR